MNAPKPYKLKSRVWIVLLELRKDRDWPRIREFFALFGMDEADAELEARFKHG